MDHPMDMRIYCDRWLLKDEVHHFVLVHHGFRW